MTLLILIPNQLHFPGDIQGLHPPLINVVFDFAPRELSDHSDSRIKIMQKFAIVAIKFVIASAIDKVDRLVS